MIFDHAATGIAIADLRGRLLRANRALTRILGYSQEELLAMSFRDFSHPHDEEKNLPNNHELMEGSAESYQMEKRYVRKDGKIVYCLITVSLLRDTDNNPVSFLAQVTDITDRIEAERELRASEERYALALLGANDGIWDWNILTGEVYFSMRWKEMLGLDITDVIHTNDEWADLIHPRDIRRVRKEVLTHLQGETVFFNSEYRIKHKSGEYIWVLTRGIAIKDRAHGVFRMAGSMSDITERVRFRQRLEYRALHDELTGLPNRTWLMQILEKRMEQSETIENDMFAILFLDLDRFKIINDSLGHHVGDDYLRNVAGILEATRTPGDIVARLGGDEFVVLLNNMKSQQDARDAADRVQKALEDSFAYEGNPLYSSASIGIALNEEHYRRPEDMLRDADAAMYRAKNQGGAGYVVFDRAMHDHMMDVLRMEALIKSSLRENRFRIFLQPIIHLATRTIHSVECLLRLPSSPDGKGIPPDRIITVAEDSGLITELGEWVIHEASRMSWMFKEQGMRIRTAVNVSTRQFQQRGFGDSLTGILERVGVAPDSIDLELTESMLLGFEKEIVDVLRRLRATGLGLSIDDFGTGFSSLAYLKQFPLTKLKIDKSFIHGVPDREQDRALVTSIITLGHSLGLEVVAEGVETPEQFAFLRDQNCDYIQGFYTARPMPFDEFVKFYESGDIPGF